MNNTLTAMGIILILKINTNLKSGYVMNLITVRALTQMIITGTFQTQEMNTYITVMILFISMTTNNIKSIILMDNSGISTISKFGNFNKPQNPNHSNPSLQYLCEIYINPF
jgi:hypothetical protein